MKNKNIALKSMTNSSRCNYLFFSVKLIISHQLAVKMTDLENSHEFLAFLHFSFFIICVKHEIK